MLMTPDELKRRLDAGEDPLDLSIEKWERVARNPDAAKTYSETYLFGDTCGLCDAYRRHDLEDGCGCIGCPLMSIERGHCCDPYSIWMEVIKSLSKKKFLAAAQAMLEALKTCKTLQEVKQWAHTSSGK